jgi:hypothetical protein
MGILFRGLEDDPRDLRELIGMGVGAGSVCWEHMENTGIFLEHRASEIVEEMITWIHTNYVHRNVALMGLTVIKEDQNGQDDVRLLGEEAPGEG